MTHHSRLGLAAATAIAIGAVAAAAPPAAAQTAPEASARLAIVALLEAKPGRGQDLADLLKAGRQIVAEEPGTITWYAVRLSPTSFAIFDTFPDEAARQAHLNGRIPAALASAADDLLAEPPAIRPAEVLAAKIPD